MKMYILIKRGTPDNMVPVIASHASLMAYLEFKDDSDCIEWLANSFKKVVCDVSEEEFDYAQSVNRCVVVTESALQGNEVALAFCPRQKYPEMFKYFPLWKPNID